ncbi:MAG: biopolymer transporter ExbD [Kiritimatiellia bacterium]
MQTEGSGLMDLPSPEFVPPPPRKRRKTRGDDAEVLLTPLIDCVFLLIVFFLVTSMFKRFERQIPVQLADSSASVAEQPREDALKIGLTRDGFLMRPAQRGGRGVLTYRRVDDAAAHLKALADEYGIERPLEVLVHRETPFQTVVDTLDLTELQGFRNVRTRVTDTAF